MQILIRSTQKKRIQERKGTKIARNSRKREREEKRKKYFH